MEPWSVILGKQIVKMYDINDISTETVRSLGDFSFVRNEDDTITLLYILVDCNSIHYGLYQIRPAKEWTYYFGVFTLSPEAVSTMKDIFACSKSVDMKHSLVLSNNKGRIITELPDDKYLIPGVESRFIANDSEDRLAFQITDSYYTLANRNMVPAWGNEFD